MRGLFLGVLLVASACSEKQYSRDCNPAMNGADCLQAGISGVCLTTCDGEHDYCAFPAPADCPETELQFGVLSGALSSTCVPQCSIVDGGAPADANVSTDACASLDAGGPQSSEVLVLTGPEIEIYDAASLALKTKVTLPSPFEGIHSFGDEVWLTSGIGQNRLHRLVGSALVAAGGYPRTFDSSTECIAERSFVGPEGWVCGTGSVAKVRRWSGDPLQIEKSVNYANSAELRIARSDRRTIVVNQDEAPSMLVLDTPSWLMVPGSPMMLDHQVMSVHTEDFTRTFLVISVDATSTYLRLYDQDSLQLEKEKVFTTTTATVSTYDSKRARYVVALNGSFVAAFDLQLNEVVAPQLTANGFILSMIYDPTRDRIYLVTDHFFSSDEIRLVALDAATLTHVSGSPVVLPDAWGLAIR